MKLHACAVAALAAGAGCQDPKLPASLATDVSLPVLQDVRDTALPLAKLERPDELTLPIVLSAGYTLLATRTRIDRRGPGDFTWTGTTKHGTAVITSHRGAVIGTVFDGTRVYRIMRGPSGRIQIARVIPPKSRPHGEPYRHGKPPTKQSEDGPIQVIAAYTRAASEQCKDIETIIRHSLDWTNWIAKESGLSTTFELAHVYETSFDEADENMHGLVDAFADKEDGKIDEVHELRDAHFADIAVLFVRSDRTVYGGMSKQTTADAETAFSVVACPSADLDFGLAHEIGHLLGLNDDFDQPGPWTFPYGYGYAHSHDDPDRSWRTVMSSSAPCKHRCPRIPRWSNPLITYPANGGDPTGTAERSDNVRVIKQTAGAVTRFRQKPK